MKIEKMFKEPKLMVVRFSETDIIATSGDPQPTNPPERPDESERLSE